MQKLDRFCSEATEIYQALGGSYWAEGIFLLRWKILQSELKAKKIAEVLNGLKNIWTAMQTY